MAGRLGSCGSPRCENVASERGAAWRRQVELTSGIDKVKGAQSRPRFSVCVHGFMDAVSCVPLWCG
jgi:hypothetical protein